MNVDYSEVIWKRIKVLEFFVHKAPYNISIKIQASESCQGFTCLNCLLPKICAVKRNHVTTIHQGFLKIPWARGFQNYVTLDEPPRTILLFYIINGALTSQPSVTYFMNDPL